MIPNIRKKTLFLHKKAESALNLVLKWASIWRFLISVTVMRLWKFNKTLKWTENKWLPGRKILKINVSLITILYHVSSLCYLQTYENVLRCAEDSFLERLHVLKLIVFSILQGAIFDHFKSFRYFLSSLIWSSKSPQLFILAIVYEIMY